MSFSILPAKSKDVGVVSDKDKLPETPSEIISALDHIMANVDFNNPLLSSALTATEVDVCLELKPEHPGRIFFYKAKMIFAVPKDMNKAVLGFKFGGVAKGESDIILDTFEPAWAGKSLWQFLEQNKPENVKGLSAAFAQLRVELAAIKERLQKTLASL